MWNSGAGDWELTASADSAGAGGSESISHGGTAFYDDSAYYAVVISSSDGDSCEHAYTLEIEG